MLNNTLEHSLPVAHGLPCPVCQRIDADDAMIAISITSRVSLHNGASLPPPPDPWPRLSSENQTRTTQRRKLFRFNPELFSNSSNSHRFYRVLVLSLAICECGVLRISRGFPLLFNFASSEEKLHNGARKETRKSVWRLVPEWLIVESFLYLTLRIAINSYEHVGCFWKSCHFSQEVW